MSGDHLAHLPAPSAHETPRLLLKGGPLSIGEACVATLPDGSTVNVPAGTVLREGEASTPKPPPWSKRQSLETAVVEAACNLVLGGFACRPDGTSLEEEELARAVQDMRAHLAARPPIAFTVEVAPPIVRKPASAIITGCLTADGKKVADVIEPHRALVEALYQLRREALEGVSPERSSAIRGRFLAVERIIYDTPDLTDASGR